MDVKIRRDMLAIAQRAIDAVRGDLLIAAQAGNTAFSEPLQLVAIGKAAAVMTLGAHQAFGRDIQRALVITKTGHVVPALDALRNVEIHEAGHPVPDQASLRAGERLLQWIDAAPAQSEFLFLISGGASSLVEAPVAGIDLALLQKINAWLLGSGLDIEQINSVRRRVSRIKGGNLLRALGQRRARVWLISDVAGDDPAVIGSGLLYPPRDGFASEVDCPDWIRGCLVETPALPQAGAVPEHRILGNLATACRAAADAAREQGYAVHVHDAELDGDAEQTGRDLATRLRELPAGVHVWGGETTVQLPPEPGRGGRNQQLALAAATVLSGSDCCLLSIGTDGTDGPTEDAGALVDGGTLSRGELAGLDAEQALRAADAGHFLEASGDLVTTGPTGTNVRDLVLACKP